MILARSRCVDLDPKFCEDIIPEHDCEREPFVKATCARTGNDCGLCKDNCFDNKCRDYCKTATKERCNIYENMRLFCPASCEICKPGA